MQCLKNYIGIDVQGAPAYAIEGEETPTASGLYINKDLPLSLVEMGSLADSEQPSLLVLWDEVQNRAIKKFINKVKAGYRELFNLCFLEDDWFCENKELLKYALLYFLGVELMIEKIYTTRINRFTRTFDTARAKELREEWQGEFYSQLKDALELIGHNDRKQQGGSVFSLVETLP